MLGVNSDEDRDAARALMARQGLAKRSWWDGGSSGPIAARWNVRGWPTVYVLDGRGVVRYRQVFGKQLDAAVDTLLREMPAGPHS